MLVLAGVHGDEGFSSSTLMCDAIDRWVSDGVDRDLADDAAVVMIHGVNPWGMSHWRRQNESNVDLNRNWGRDERVELPSNPGYLALHRTLVPGGAEPPSPESLLDVTRAMVEEYGHQWVKSAVSAGQYSHPDGLYFGGDRTEESNLRVAEIVALRLAGVEEVLVVDLHTGHGAPGTYTLLSHVSEDHPDDAWLRRVFDADRIECTSASDATTGPKHGQIASGLGELVPGAVWRTVTMELGTISDTRMIVNERAEHWVHFHGDRSNPVHARIVWDHRCGSTPDDPEWERAARCPRCRRPRRCAPAAEFGGGDSIGRRRLVSSSPPTHYRPGRTTGRTNRRSIMGLFDSIKSKFGGNKTQVKQGIDKAADAVGDKAGAHADKVQQGAEAAKDVVDKLPDA